MITTSFENGKKVTRFSPNPDRLGQEDRQFLENWAEKKGAQRLSPPDRAQGSQTASLNAAKNAGPSTPTSQLSLLPHP